MEKPSQAAPSGMHLNFYINRVINLLRTVQKPLSVQDILKQCGVDVKRSHPDLFKELTRNNKVKFEDEKFSYKPLYDVRSKQDLLQLLKDTYNAGGFDMQELGDSFLNVKEAVADLVKSSEIFCCGNKDGSKKTLFYNPFPGIQPVEEEFKSLWHAIKVPDEVDLEKALEREGLKSFATSSITPARRVPVQQSKKPGQRQRRIKLTNVHLDIDLNKK